MITARLRRPRGDSNAKLSSVIRNRFHRNAERERL
jgi:hypothetical protein